MKRLSLVFSVIILGIFSTIVIAQDDNEQTYEWRRGADMPTPRSEIASAVLDGRIYVGGGLGGGTAGFVAYDDFEVYDIDTDSWEILAPLPLALHHPAMTATDDAVYLSGGYNGSTFTPTVTAVWQYTPSDDEWLQLTDMPAPRAGHAMVTLDNHLYIIGGVASDPTALWIYDIENDEWNLDAEPLPSPREHLAASVHDGKIYVVGGRWQIVGNVGFLQVYDPATNTWEFLPDMPTPRGGLTAATVGDRIHVIGGEALQGEITFAEHEAFDIESGEWLTLPDLPTARHGLTSSSWDDALYVIGGAEGAGGQTTSTLVALVEIYTPVEDE